MGSRKRREELTEENRLDLLAEFDRASRGCYSRYCPTDAHAILATLGDQLGPAGDERDELVRALVREINGRKPLLEAS